jgi:hypothetical protein
LTSIWPAFDSVFLHQEKAKVGIGVYFQRSKDDEGALVVKVFGQYLTSI